MSHILAFGATLLSLQTVVMNAQKPHSSPIEFFFSTIFFPMSLEELEHQNPSTETADDDDRVPEEEVTVVEGWAPSVTLEVKEHNSTGEEEEEALFSQRSKLLRWVVNESEGDGPAGEWKERGTGDVKLLLNKANMRVRLLMRQEKTNKIVANHYVVGDADPYYSLKPNAGSDKIWVWMAQDFAEGELVVEQFALKFGTPEKAKGFFDAFEDAKKRNAEVMGSTGESDDRNESHENSSTEKPEVEKDE